MSDKIKGTRRRRSTDPGRQPNAPDSGGVIVGRRRYFRFAAAVGIPLLLLLVVEVSLRLAGSGYAAAFFLRRQIDGRGAWIDNPEFGRRFFPPGLVRYPKPMKLPAAKAPGTLRVFVFGESAAMGDPEPRFGLPRMLEVLLRERFPERRVEVVNAAMVAINSHVILPIARECAGLEGDLWVIYMGNNEMIGPFGSLSQFGTRSPPRPFIRASLAVKSSRIGQVLDAGLHRFRRGSESREWSGMTLWQDQKVHPDDPSVARVYRHFGENLRAIVEIGRRARVPIILCTVAANLKDCAPFGSLHVASLTAAQLKDWEAAYQQGVTLEGKNNFAEARVHFERALTLDPNFADLCFRLARCYLALGEVTKAQQLFRQALNNDALQFRADSQINMIIRQCAESQGVHLLDAEQLLAKASTHHLPGREYFYEHVHLNPAGNDFLARGVAERAAVALGLEASNREQPGVGPSLAEDDRALESSKRFLGNPWLSQAACLESLGFTEWNRQRLLERILERMEQPPFTRQVNHNEQLALLRQSVQQGRSATKPIEMQRAARQIAQVIARRPEDPDLRWNLAELLDIADDLPGAEEQWRAVIRLLPHAHLPYHNLAKLLSSHGRTREALELYEQCLLINPDYFLAAYELGSLLLQEGRATGALAYLRRAVKQKPNSIEARLALGLALRQTGHFTQATREFQEVLRLQPSHVRARKLLGPESRN